MSKQNNLTDFLTGVADAIRAKKGTTALINPQNFESEIASISGGSELNIAYGDTAPEDTSKLWIKSEKPSNISFPILWNPEHIVEGITNTGTTLPTTTSGITTAVVGAKIYLFGGVSLGDKVLVFDTTNNTIQTLSITLPYYMGNCGTAAVGNKIYLFGGTNTKNMIQVFDTTNNTIQTLSTKLPNEVTDIAAAAVGSKIYLFGGYLGSRSALNKIQVFDTTTNTIKTLSAKLSTEEYLIATAVVGSKIYLFGGLDWGDSKLNKIQVFDTTTNTIQTLSTTLPTAAYGIGTGAAGTKIYLFGGNGSSISNTIQVFDTITNTIQTLSTKLPTAAYGIGTAAVDTKIYLFGGYSNDYTNTIKLFTVNIPLSSNDIIVTQEYDPRTFKVLKSPTEVEVSVKYVYKGDSSNRAMLIDAYLYDGANWVNVNTGAVAAISRTITATLTNVTAASGNATTIATGETKVLTYTAASGYTLPDSVTVTGATGVWNKDAGTLTLSNPTENVTFTIAGVQAVTGYNVTVTAGGNSSDFTVYDGQSSSGNLLGTFSANQTGDVICSSGYLYFTSSAYNGVQSTTGGVTKISDTLCSVSGDGTVNVNFFCLIEGTQITLADGSTKAVENITYDDELLVWNFYAGRFDKAKPTWIKVAEVAPRYNLVKFSNGSEVGFVGAGGEKGYHRIFNKEAGAFTYTGNFKETPNGTTTFAQDGTFPTVVSQEIVEKEVKFYNVITENHYNIFANGILTSCKLSNKYRIEDMRYIGEKLISDEQEKAYFERIENKRK